MAANGGPDGSIQSESTIFSSGTNNGTPDLRFLHYNDVYHVEPGSREPVGGIARFQTLCQSYRSSNPKYAGQSELLTFFSGDAFNPSLESSVTKGKHMLAPLNDLHTDYLAKRCKFPWLCANVLDPALGENIPLGNCRRSVMLESSDGIKIGVIGVVEREWLDTINTLPPNLKYLSASATVAELAPLLRKEGAEMIVVVSHQRQPNDEKLATKLRPGVADIILGGHDHNYEHVVVNSIHVIRSGTDFKQLSYIEARRNGTSWDFNITRRDVVSSIIPDPTAVAMVKNITAKLRPMLEKPIGYTSAPLDARFTTVRNKESNLGNFVCDLMRFHYNTDCCIMASGTIRGDQIYPPGVLRVREIMNCFPFEDPCVVIAVKGKHIVAALENAVGKYPALEGRFPQVSNIEFTFDPAKPEGSRCFSISIGEAPVDLEKEYTVSTREYMSRGKDGFTSLMLEEEGGPARSIVSDENGGLLSMIIRQYFMSLKVMGKWKRFGDTMGKHFEHVQEGLHKVHPILNASPVEAPGAKNGKTRSGVDVATEKQEEANGDVRESLVGKAQQHRRQVSELTQRPAKARKLDGQESSQAADLSDSEDDDDELAGDLAQERELAIKRKVMRKWWRLAGLPGNPRMVEQKGDEFAVAWTKGIAPRLEGRIKIVGVEA
ncbi:Putative 5'-Nucleotidase/apyrase, metallo-dependent phosphatase, 5'-Nucleotidase domain superfamily [Septoria linicola]|uniref:5'-Nucleotidase/apyrase, metallo-dependent phosphatase, 5'-Nucleotidase domain superfamily n=1 Tax=Septoria linicola TaxID=215465 RepID=A0A9Q9EHG9_9PEZI|nr:Putative 5'-Nucleotidase/apyrase, metallo-dependent phosphatase, 5'-Nucleotidase domain superfamily [Septoria linicola]